MGLLRRHRARLARGERGIALVEMTIVAPLLALLVGGIIEYGTLWRDNLTVTSGTRAAARVVSNLGDNFLADYESLLSLDAALASLEDITVEGALIYDATAVDGEPHSSCFDAADDPISSGGYCNHYTAAEIASMASTSCTSGCTAFPNNSNCAGGLATYFCPQTDRETDQGAAAGLTSVGVWVRINRQYFTGLFPGDGVTITDQAVMIVEPG